MYKDSEVIEVLAEAILRGRLCHIEQGVENALREKVGGMAASDFKTILIKEGQLSEVEANKVYVNIGMDTNKIEYHVFNGRVNQALTYAKERSKALRKVTDAVTANAKLVCQRLEQQDYNKDGALNIDGFKAALLVRETDCSAAELEECFYLVANRRLP